MAFLFVLPLHVKYIWSHACMSLDTRMTVKQNSGRRLERREYFIPILHKNNHNQLFCRNRPTSRWKIILEHAKKAASLAWTDYSLLIIVVVYLFNVLGRYIIYTN